MFASLRKYALTNLIWITVAESIRKTRDEHPIEKPLRVFYQLWYNDK
jgi:hypothetical protein